MKGTLQTKGVKGEETGQMEETGQAKDVEVGRRTTRQMDKKVVF